MLRFVEASKTGDELMLSLGSLAERWPSKTSAVFLAAHPCARRVANAMRNWLDYLAKQISCSALGPSGTAIPHFTINPETLFADLYYEPDPAKQAERDRLGLLGRLASRTCLFEVYSQTPSMEEFRVCMIKQFAVWQKRLRDARAQNRKRDLPLASHAGDAVETFLWVITAGVPTTLFTELQFEVALGWPPGVYLFGNDGLRVGLVVGSMLPRDRSTLLVRLIAAGALLADAVAELAALPPDSIERAVAEPVLVDLQRTLGQSSSHGLDEQEFLMVMLKSWEDGKAEARQEGRVEGRQEGRVEGRQEGRVEGRQEGRVEGLVEAVLTALRMRGIHVPEVVRERVMAENDLDRLQRWLERAIVAGRLEDVVDVRI